MSVCPYCEKFDRDTFLSLKMCPRCDGDLIARVERSEHSTFRRDLGSVAHPVEVEYANAPVVDEGEPIEHDAGVILDYAIGLLTLTRKAIDAVRPSTLVLGFMTGSADLAWLLRRRYGTSLDGQVRFAPGLRTPGARPNLDAILDGSWAAGNRSIVVIDEVVSGSQMRTNLAAIDSWAVARNVAPQLHVALVGMRPGYAEASEDVVRTRILRDSAKYKIALTGVTLDLVTVPKLLAMDTEGRPLKGVWGGGCGNYTADRIWPGGYRVRCRNRLTFEGCADLDVIWSAASLDQVFATLLWSICGFAKDQDRVWPGRIVQRGCGECRERLARARTIASALPPAERNEDTEGEVVARYEDGRWVPSASKRLITDPQELVRWERQSKRDRKHRPT